MHPFINVADKKTVVSRPKSSSLSTGTRDVTSVHPTTNSIEMIGWGEESEGSVKELDEGEDDSLDVEWSKDSDIEANDGSDSESVKEVNEERDDDDGGHSRDSLDEVDECQSDDCFEVHSHNYDIDADEKVNFHVGMCFTTVVEFRVALREYNVQLGTDILKKKNESRRVTAICAAEGCRWRIHASPTSDGVTFMVKSYNGEHTCSRLPKNPNANARWIATKLASRLRADPDMKIASMHTALNLKYGINPHKLQLHKARRISRQETEGSFVTSYAQLPSYGELLKEKNPGTVFKLKYAERFDFTQPIVFKRVFICLDACRKGFIRGCRPFIGIDGCHLRGSYGGVLLSEISMDGNNELFPLAYAVVENETKDSWSCFLYNLYSTIGSEIDGVPLTFMSDRQKGLADVIAEISSHANHRNCCRHMYANFRGKYPAMLLRNDFWTACRAHSAVQFQKVMAEMKIHNKEAHDWLLRIPFSMWARHAFDHRVRSDHITNNMSESFNQWVNNFRGKPILTLLDSIRQKLMTTLAKRYEKGCTYKEKLTPMAKKKLELAKTAARFCMPIFAGGNEFEVVEANSRRLVVSLNRRICGCGVWESSGIPCKHAAAALIYRRENLEDYCDAYYSMERYMQAYGEIINPLPDLDNLPSVTELGVLNPPQRKRLKGRPHKNRRRAVDEAPADDFRKKTGTVRCERCKEMGHNRRTCQNAPVNEKGCSSRQRVAGKGSQNTSTLAVSSQMHTRSQTSTTPSSQISKQTKLRAQKAAKLERQKKRMREGLGQ